MDKKDSNNEISLNKETVDVLITNIIPTTKYFESRFDHLQYQIDEIKSFQVEFKKDIDNRFLQFREYVDDKFEQVDKRFEQVDKRFEQIDKRFEQVDKRFEQIDKRFEQVDKRFEQVDKRIDKVEERLSGVENNIVSLTKSINDLKLEIQELGKKQEVTIREYIIERDRFYDKKFAQNRTYFLATASLIAGIILKMVGIINIPTIG